MEEAKSDEAEYQEPVEAPKEEPMEPLETPQDITTTKTETVRTRKPKKAATPSVVIPRDERSILCQLATYTTRSRKGNASAKDK